MTDQTDLAGQIRTALKGARGMALDHDDTRLDLEFSNAIDALDLLTDGQAGDAGPEHVHHGLWCAPCLSHGAANVRVAHGAPTMTDTDRLAALLHEAVHAVEPTVTCRPEHQEFFAPHAARLRDAGVTPPPAPRMPPRCAGCVAMVRRWPPTTAAGRALLAAPWMLLPGHPLMADAIAAIEAEAIGAERARLAKAVQKIEVKDDTGDNWGDPNLVDDHIEGPGGFRAVVLKLLEPAR